MTVSIIMPAYNRAELLPRSIGSVRRQTFEDWELIVVDDRSADATKDVVEDYQRRDARIRYFVNDHSKGPAGARNCGLEKAGGEFIAFLDSDDEWDERYLGAAVKALRTENVEIFLALFSQQKDGKFEKRYSWSAAKIIADLSSFEKEGAFYFLEKNICDYMVLNWMFFYHLDAMVIRKRSIHAVGGFDEGLWSGEDFEFVFRALLYYDRFCLLNDHYYLYYQNEDSLVNFSRSAFSDLEVVRKLGRHKLYEIKALQKIKSEVALSSRIRNKKRCLRSLDHHLGEMYYALGSLEKRIDKFRAFRHLLVSLRYGFSFLKVKELALLLRPCREK